MEIEKIVQQEVEAFIAQSKETLPYEGDELLKRGRSAYLNTWWSRLPRGAIRGINHQFLNQQFYIDRDKLLEELGILPNLSQLLEEYEKQSDICWKISRRTQQNTHQVIIGKSDLQTLCEIDDQLVNFTFPLYLRLRSLGYSYEQLCN
ncbi:MAG: hypothetical protein Q7R96_06415 [Nanoarchaeota archaeon]|nr:hypothetical protein [Nanoarchaeota archaeon]